MDENNTHKNFSDRSVVDKSFVETNLYGGQRNVAIGQYGYACGSNSTAIGYNSCAIGGLSYVQGYQNIVNNMSNKDFNQRRREQKLKILEEKLAKLKGGMRVKKNPVSNYDKIKNIYRGTLDKGLQEEFKSIEKDFQNIRQDFNTVFRDIDNVVTDVRQSTTGLTGTTKSYKKPQTVKEKMRVVTLEDTIDLLFNANIKTVTHEDEEYYEVDFRDDNLTTMDGRMAVFKGCEVLKEKKISTGFMGMGKPKFTVDVLRIKKELLDDWYYNEHNKG